MKVKTNDWLELVDMDARAKGRHSKYTMMPDTYELVEVIAHDGGTWLVLVGTSVGLPALDWQQLQIPFTNGTARVTAVAA